MLGLVLILGILGTEIAFVLDDRIVDQLGAVADRLGSSRRREPLGIGAMPPLHRLGPRSDRCLATVFRGGSDRRRVVGRPRKERLLPAGLR